MGQTKSPELERASKAIGQVPKSADGAAIPRLLAAHGVDPLAAIGQIAIFTERACSYAEQLSQDKVKWEDIPVEFQNDIRQYNSWAMRGKSCV